MKNTFSLEQTSKTGSLESILLLHQYRLDLMARFVEIKPNNWRLRQDQIAKELVCSSSTLQRCRHDIDMLSSYGFPTKITKENKRFQIVNKISKGLK